MPRLKIEFNDDVSAKLLRLGKEFPQSLDRVLRSVSMATKTYVLTSERRTFTQQAGKMEKSTKYKKTGKARYRLSVGSVYDVHEKGAYITPKNGEVLRFINKSGEEVFTKFVRIPKRPFFKKGIRAAITADAINRAAEASLELEFKRLKIR